jgi:pyridoxamine 5'-phosphate oxidase
MTISDLRKEYTVGGLTEAEIRLNPIEQFFYWLDQAIVAQVPEPNAMSLATATPDGKPSARIVLLKGCDERGFTFFTNYLSRKGREIAENPYVAAVFFWHELERQVRIEGKVERVSDAESDAYHHSRPIGSQLGAWTSEQSEVISGRKVLEDRLRELTVRFGSGEIPRPPHWGGFRIIPDVIEFWQGRPNRLHDRIQFRRVDGTWIMERLAP